MAKDPRFQRLTCTHKGTYADDCLVERVERVRDCFGLTEWIMFQVVWKHDGAAKMLNRHLSVDIFVHMESNFVLCTCEWVC